MLRVLRPLERIVAEWLISPWKCQPTRSEERCGFPRFRIIRANYGGVRLRIAIRVRVSPSPFDPVHISGSLTAAEYDSGLERFVHVRKALLFLRVGSERKEKNECNEVEPGGSMHCEWEGGRQRRRAQLRRFAVPEDRCLLPGTSGR